MTIGALGHSLSSSIQTQDGQNPDFLKLIECRNAVAAFLQVEETSLELSMGMSNDFAEAIAMGSTNVRIGSSIFGSRNYPSNPEKTSEQNKTLEQSGIIDEQAQKISSTSDSISNINLEK